MADSPEKIVDPQTRRIHHTLAHSYFVYFLFLIVGIALDYFYPLRFFTNTASALFGVLLLILGTGLIFWAQRSNRHLHKNGNLTKEDFLCGPYCYSRTPTHWGLFVLTMGLAVVLNAFFVFLSTILSFIITKLIFLRRYEEVLEDKYGDAYREYEKMVRL